MSDSALLEVALDADDPARSILRQALAGSGVLVSGDHPGNPDASVRAHAHFGRAERRSLEATRCDIPLVVVLEEVSLRGVQEAIGAGARAVVELDDAVATLAVAVRAAVAGLVSFPTRVAERFARPALSAREKQVLGLVVMGFGNAAIADQLHIAQTTVKTHIASIFEKLGVRSRSAAVSLVLDPVDGRGLGVMSMTTNANDG